jgi:hypothetical protein
LGLGLDVRGDGGYVILPPSQRDDGGGYKWTELSAPGPSEAPQWLINLLIAPKERPPSQPVTSFVGNGRADAYARTALEHECEAVTTAQPGSRNDALNRSAFSLFQLAAAGALSEAQVRERLFSAATACGLVNADGADAVWRTIESGRAAGFKQPRGIPSPRTEPNSNETKDGAQNQNNRLRYKPYRDIERAPRKLWLIENFLGDGEASCDFGAPGSGKSVLAGDRVLHVAAGTSWFGRRVTQGAGLYVAAERSTLAMRRFAAFRLHHGLDDLPVAIISGSIDLRSSHVDADKIIDCARRLEDETGQKLRLVEIDTVSRVLAGGDENSPKDMGALVGNIAWIQEKTGGHVNLVHHVPHGQDRMRGHGLLVAAMDTTVHVENRGGVRTAAIDKTNDGDEGECLTFTLRSIELFTDPETGQITTAPVVEAVESAPQIVPNHKRATALPKGAQTALRALREAVGACGVVPPASNYIPEHIRVVTVDQWRDYSYRMGISTSTEERARQQAFKRATDTLIGGQHVGFWNNQVWPAS